jgi:hypothetical protein
MSQLQSRLQSNLPELAVQSSGLVPRKEPHANLAVRIEQTVGNEFALVRSQFDFVTWLWIASHVADRSGEHPRMMLEERQSVSRLQRDGRSHRL